MTALALGAAPGHLAAAGVCLVLCGVLGWFVPVLIARLPEPETEPGLLGQSETDDRLFAPQLPPAPPKEPYVEMARAPGLRVGSAVGASVVGGLVGDAVGWTGALLYLVPLVPIGVALLVIDWRVHLLPTRIMHPTYLLMLVLVPLAALVDQDLTSLYRAGWGWLVIGGWFWGFWFLTRGGGWGFGDVRLARVLGPALGYLGWPQMLMGLVLITLVGGVGAVASVAVSRKLRMRIPYGPYMLVGALLAVLVGPDLARGLGY